MSLFFSELQLQPSPFFIKLSFVLQSEISDITHWSITAAARLRTTFTAGFAAVFQAQIRNTVAQTHVLSQTVTQGSTTT